MRIRQNNDCKFACKTSLLLLEHTVTVLRLYLVWQYWQLSPLSQLTGSPHSSAVFTLGQGVDLHNREYTEYNLVHTQQNLNCESENEFALLAVYTIFMNPPKKTFLKIACYTGTYRYGTVLYCTKLSYSLKNDC